MDFEILDQLLKRRGISRRKLALAVGINENKMSSAFKRLSGLSSEDVLKIAEYLGVSPYYLEGLTKDPSSFGLSPDESYQAMGEDLEVLTRLADYDKSIQQQNRQRLNAAFDKLSLTGQHEAVKRVEELTEIPRYTGTEDHQEG